MKKLLPVVLVVTMSLFLVACGCGRNDNNLMESTTDNNQSSTNTNGINSSTDNSSTQFESQNNTQGNSNLNNNQGELNQNNNGIGNSNNGNSVSGNNGTNNGTGVFGTGSTAEILDAVWGSYNTNDLFSGERSSLDLSDTETLNTMVGFPESSVSMIEEAELLMHGMNANTFTCGGFRVSDSANVRAVAESIRDNVMTRQWMCGFPDRLLILQVDDNYIFSAFGKTEAMSTFESYFMKGYPDTVVLYDEVIE